MGRLKFSSPFGRLPRRGRPALLAAKMLVASFVAVIAWGSEVVLLPLDGESVEGELKALSGAKIELETADGARTIDVKDVQSVQFSPAGAANKPQVWLKMVDGSQLVGLSYQAADGEATLELLSGDSVKMPTRSIRWVRFREQEGELAGQWAEITKGEPESDLLVIRKTSTRTIEQPGQEPRAVTETALDELDGTVLSVAHETAKFEFAGESLDVKREKIEGIVYFHPVKRELPAAVCRVLDADGSTWTARSIELSSDRLKLVSTAGVSASLPLAQLAQIDFSSGNVKFLGELEAEASLGSVSFQPRNMTATFKQLREPRWVSEGRDRPFGSESLSIGGKTFSRGMVLSSRSRLAYAIPEGMRWFRAEAGLDDAAGPAANLTLILLADTREVYRHTFSADQPREVQPIELDLASATRLTIAIEDGSGLDIADQLNLANARFTK